MSALSLLKHKLFEPVDSLICSLFLRAFGLIVILQAISYSGYGFIEQGILAPKFLFPFDFFGFVRPLSEQFMKFLMLLMLASGILLVVQKWVKLALCGFLASFSYFFLLDKSYYNNHFYLFILVAFLYLFFREKTDEQDRKVTPYWFLLLLQVQIVIVYFYGGLAKLNADWLLHQQPMRILLKDSANNALLPDLNSSTFALYLLTYGGLLFDLLVGFMLWYRPARKLAMILAAGFHLSNLLLFNFGDSGEIGSFPVFMIFSLLLFVAPDKVRARIGSRLPAGKKADTTQAPAQRFNENRPLVLTCLGLYLAFQLLFPLRHLLYSGNTSWTAKASKFAWRMKINNKRGDIRFFVRSKPADPLREINVGGLINTAQRSAMADDPVAILQLAHFIGEELRDRGATQPAVYAYAQVSLNGRPFYPVVDSSINLLELEHDPIGPDKWILPLKD